MSDNVTLTMQRYNEMVRLVGWALEIAAAPGLRQNRFSRDAYVPWRYIHGLRADIEKAGLDWRAVKRSHQGNYAEKEAPRG